MPHPEKTLADRSDAPREGGCAIWQISRAKIKANRAKFAVMLYRPAPPSSFAIRRLAVARAPRLLRSLLLLSTSSLLLVFWVATASLLLEFWVATSSLLLEFWVATSSLLLEFWVATAGFAGGKLPAVAMPLTE
jgi:hypothetical protein